MQVKISFSKLLLPFVLFSSLSSGQNSIAENDEKTSSLNITELPESREEEMKESAIIFITTEVPPILASCKDAKHQSHCSNNNLLSYVYQNLRYTGDSLIDHGSRIFASFVIDTNGDVQGVRVHRGMELASKTNIVSVLCNLPKWIPGTQHRTPVSVQYNLPIKIRLE